MKILRNMMLLFWVLLSNTYASELANKQIQVILPFAPGGTVDMIFRDMQTYASSQNINLNPIYKPGANGLIGLKELSQAPTNGLTIGLTLVDSIAAYTLNTKQEVDVNNILFLHRSIFGVVVNAESDLYTWDDLIKKAKFQKKGASIGFSANSQQLLINKVIELEQIPNEGLIVVNYSKAGSNIISAIIGGHLDAGIGALAMFGPHIDSGKLRLIAVDSNAPSTIYPQASVIKSLYPTLALPGRGSAVVIPNNTNADMVKAWKTFITDYKNSNDFKSKSRLNFQEIGYPSVNAIKKIIDDNIDLLNQLK